MNRSVHEPIDGRSRLETDPVAARAFRIGFFFFALVLIAWPSWGGERPGASIRCSGMFSHDGGGRVEYRAPVALNDDHDTGLQYTAKRFWDCFRNCPDGAVCDHRTLEPVWDHLYVGGRVEAEDDLLKLEIHPPAGAGPAASVRFAVLEGGECVRLWRHPKKGAKRDILPNSGTVLSRSDLPAGIYVEGIRSGTAKVACEPADGSAPAFILWIDVIRLVESQQGARKVIYDAGDVTFALEPEAVLRSPAYAGKIVWSGDSDGKGLQRRVVRYDPGDEAALRRAIYRPRVVVNGDLAFETPIRVRQRTWTGSPVATTTAARRREVESLLTMPRHGLMDTALPNKSSVIYSQAWFEQRYTGSSKSGDPVKPVNQVRLQYAANMGADSNLWGVACCYLKPYGVFVTKLAYDSGLKLEDLRGIAHHELRHLTHFMEMYNATGLWHVLCRDLPRAITTYFMEADASSASLHGDASWRYLHKSARDMVENYRQAVEEVGRLPSLPQRTAGIKVLHDIYAGLPPDMTAFKRPGYDCHIRPPREIDER